MVIAVILASDFSAMQKRYSFVFLHLQFFFTNVQGDKVCNQGNFYYLQLVSLLDCIHPHQKRMRYLIIYGSQPLKKA